jgi:oligo-1,6-glucosidase
VVRHGAYREHFPLNGNVYCYSRSTETERLLVVCSFTDRNTKMRVPGGFNLSEAELILQNYPEEAGNTLKPYECRVYHWKV